MLLYPFTRRLLTGAVSLCLPLFPVHAAPEAEVFHVKTLRAQMRYDVTEIEARPGAKLKIVFENSDDMPHNMVFCQPGTDVVALTTKQMEHPEEALRRNWLPDDPAVWMHSKLLNPHETEELEFTAPETPGDYPFVCSFPGHALTMKGRLRLLPDGVGLKDLHFKLYLGSWQKLPDFSTLTPHREGTVPDNLIQLKFDDYKNQYGVVYSGKITAPKNADYFFLLSSDDGGRISIDGKKVVEYDGIHPSSDIKEGKVSLTAGEHDFTLEYFQQAGNADLFAAWRSADFAVTPLSKWLHPNWKGGQNAKKKIEYAGLPLAVGEEPILYRNFITGAGNRGIGVGYPGQANIAWSAEAMNLVLIWRGAFIDAARHWRDRGGGFQAPLGFDVVRLAPDLALPFATAQEAQSAWPKVEAGGFAEGYQWKGYRLDPKQYPTFMYRWGKVDVTDRFEVEGDAVAGGGKLIRTIKLTGEIPADAIYHLATGAKIEPANGGFLVDGGRFDQEGRGFENKILINADGAKVIGQYLVVPARSEIRVAYTWPETHVHAAAQ